MSLSLQFIITIALPLIVTVLSAVRFDMEPLRSSVPSVLMLTDVDALIGDPSKAETELNWKAKVKWKQLAHIMVDAELKGV